MDPAFAPLFSPAVPFLAKPGIAGLWMACLPTCKQTRLEDTGAIMSLHRHHLSRKVKEGFRFFSIMGGLQTVFLCLCLGMKVLLCVFVLLGTICSYLSPHFSPPFLLKIMSAFHLAQSVELLTLSEIRWLDSSSPGCSLSGTWQNPSGSHRPSG